MGSWTYSANPTQGCTAQQKASSGYGKNVLGTQNRIWKMGKTTQVTEIVQKRFDGLPKAKMTSIHTQLVQTKQRMPTQKLQVLGLKENFMEAKTTRKSGNNNPMTKIDFT